MSRSVTVAAAVIRRDGRILIGQRRRTDSHPLKWEFPGGKIESGESPVAGLRRELREELGIEAEPGREICRYVFKYTGRPAVELIFFEVTDFAGDLCCHAFEQILWEPPDRLRHYDFLEGDVDFVRRLAADEFSAA